MLITKILLFSSFLTIIYVNQSLGLQQSQVCHLISSQAYRNMTVTTLLSCSQLQSVVKIIN